MKCNTALGMVEDNRERLSGLIRYLEHDALISGPLLQNGEDYNGRHLN